MQSFMVLMPQEAPSPVASKHKISVQATTGSSVQANVIWLAEEGSTRILFTTPSGTTSYSAPTWSWDGSATPGTYSIEIVGNPVAYNGMFVLTLVMYPC